MARGVGGGAVGACTVILAGWRLGQLGRGKAVVARNECGESWSVFHGNMPNKYLTADEVHLGAVRSEP